CADRSPDGIGLFFSAEFESQPRASVGPVLIGGGRGNAKSPSGLLHGQPGEEPELDQIGPPPILLLQLHQRLIQGDEVTAGFFTSRLDRIQVESLPASSCLLSALVSGILDQDPPHRFRSGRKEVAPAVPVLWLRTRDEAEICFVNQGCRLKSLSGL